MKTRLPRALAGTLGALACALQMGAAFAFEWSDTSIHYWYGPYFREPGVTGNDGRAADIGKNIISLTHADGYRYGTNFFNVDMLMSNGADPSNNGSSGAQEFYAVYRHNLSLNAVAGKDSFAFGPVRDVSIAAGFDLNTKNTAFAPRKRMLVLGPNFQFDVPGFLNVALLYRYEQNYNGIVGKSVSFRSTAMLESSWRINFQAGGIPLSFEGYGSLTGPKGNDGFGQGTKTEFLFHPKLMVDVGALAGARKQTFQVGLGWEYWHNKFGADHTKVAGAIQSTPFIEAAVHF